MTLNKVMIIGNLEVRPRDALYGRRQGGLRASHCRQRPNRVPTASGRRRPSGSGASCGSKRPSALASSLRKGREVYAEGGCAPAVGRPGRPEAEVPRGPLRRVQPARASRARQGGGFGGDIGEGASDAPTARGGPAKQRRPRRPGRSDRRWRHPVLTDTREGDRPPMASPRPAARRRIATAIDAGARSATSASTKRRRSTTRRSPPPPLHVRPREDRAAPQDRHLARHQRMLTVALKQAIQLMIMCMSPLAPVGLARFSATVSMRW